MSKEQIETVEAQERELSDRIIVGCGTRWSRFYCNNCDKYDSQTDTRSYKCNLKRSDAWDPTINYKHGIDLLVNGIATQKQSDQK